MLTRILTIGAAFIALLVMSSAQNDPVQATTTDRTIQRLEKTILELEARVERLEGRAALQSPGFLDGATAPAAPPEPGAPGAPSAASAAGPPSRVMRLDSIETAVPDPGADDELERLREEVEALERTVGQSDRKMASLTGSSGSGGGYRGRYSPDTSDSRQRRAESEIQADYKTKLRQKQGELKRLERDLTEPRQIINGSWDGKIIMLQTTRDASRALDKVDVGDVVTWDGRRMSQDDNSEEWVVTSVSKSDWQGPPK